MKTLHEYDVVALNEQIIHDSGSKIATIKILNLPAIL